MSKREFDPTTVGVELGDTAVNQAVDRLERVCSLEKDRRTQINAAEITGLRAEFALRTEERDELRAEIRRIPRPDPTPRRSRAWYITVAAVLCLGSFFFLHMSFSPFSLGWEAWLYSAALAVVCAYATDEVLEKCNCYRIVVAVAVVSWLVSLVGLLILAFVRGDIVLLYLRNALSAGSATPDGGEDVIRFYANAAPKLALFFALLALGTELAAGLAIFEVRRIGGPASDLLKPLKERLRIVETEMIALVRRIEFLKREADIFENEFTRDFYLGLIQGAARRASKHLAPFVGLVLCLTLFSTPIQAERLDVVTGLDLSLTSAAENYDGKLEHAKNVDGTARLIERLPRGAQIRVLGITDQSFSRPLVLLSGELPMEPGPLALINRIEIARGRLASAMRDLARTVVPKYPQTDVIGFLMVASDLFREATQARKVLVIFSDMRHSAPPPDIESPRIVPAALALQTIEAQHQIADLRDVDVYIYGAHAAQKDIPYWQSLRAFWELYFAKSGATLKTYSMMRDIQGFAAELKPAGQR